MKSATTITFALPVSIGREIEKAAKQERKTVTELVTETFRRYQAKKTLMTFPLKHASRSKKGG